MTRLERFILSLMFALIVAGITLVVASAQTPDPEEPVSVSTADTNAQQGTSEARCGICHSDHQNAWFTGAHGHATSDPVFTDSWNLQGKPGACLVCHVTGYDPATATWSQDGVSCEACHGPDNPNHPKEPMTVDRTADLCGRCHSDTRFGWDEWKVSAHYQRDMTCTVCHDPHTAALKTIAGEYGETPDTSSLCLNCHKDYAMEFPYSVHSQKGIKCVDCHLRHLGDQATDEIHSMPDHSFTANIATCTKCHAAQMHSSNGDSAVEIESMTPPLVVEESGSGTNSETPSPVSPAGFAGLAGLLGLAGGMVLAPWMERWYRRMNKSKEDK
jgi:predicted CXXCH cytochrome family protein